MYGVQTLTHRKGDQYSLELMWLLNELIAII